VSECVIVSVLAFMHVCEYECAIVYVCVFDGMFLLVFVSLFVYLVACLFACFGC